MDGMMSKSLMEVGITDSGPNNRQTACYYDRFFFFFWLVDSPVDCRFTREVGLTLCQAAGVYHMSCLRIFQTDILWINLTLDDRFFLSAPVLNQRSASCF